ncbi:hypothetical protein OIU84_000628, partial [Salix udensis]
MEKASSLEEIKNETVDL